MPYDHTLRSLSHRRKAEMIYKQFINDCNTKVGLKFIIGGCAHGLYGVNYVSEDAFNIISKNFPKLIDIKNKCIKQIYSQTKNFIVFEHVIPVNVIYNILKDMYDKGNLSLDNVSNVIENVKYAVISKEEDKRLNIAKLRSKMPEGWLFGKDDIFSRYNMVDIKIHNW